MTLLLFKVILILAVFAISLFMAAYSTYAERKVAAFMQDRLAKMGSERTFKVRIGIHSGVEALEVAGHQVGPEQPAGGHRVAHLLA